MKKEELSKCCKVRASWNFSFKSCNKCGKPFEPVNPCMKKEKTKKCLCRFFGHLWFWKDWDLPNGQYINEARCDRCGVRKNDPLK